MARACFVAREIPAHPVANRLLTAVLPVRQLEPVLNFRIKMQTLQGTDAILTAAAVAMATSRSLLHKKFKLIHLPNQREVSGRHSVVGSEQDRRTVLSMSRGAQNAIADRQAS